MERSANWRPFWMMMTIRLLLRIAITELANLSQRQATLLIMLNRNLWDIMINNRKSCDRVGGMQTTPKFSVYAWPLLRLCLEQRLYYCVQVSAFRLSYCSAYINRSYARSQCVTVHGSTLVARTSHDPIVNRSLLFSASKKLKSAAKVVSRPHFMPSSVVAAWGPGPPVSGAEGSGKSIPVVAHMFSSHLLLIYGATQRLSRMHASL